jgi:hypothetical protein
VPNEYVVEHDAGPTVVRPDNTLLLEGENEAAELLTSMAWHEHSSSELGAIFRP